ncbi:MAG: bifunctional 5,10-methylenetetrahydrofolate dehydrogenase/5,10-methenyltetrahydrofolate cyclohydrolase [Thermoplasmata archaeon]
MQTQRLEGKPVAEAVDAEVRAAIRSVPASTRPPTLASVHRGVDSPFRFYLKRQRKAAEALGIRFREEALAPSDGPEELVRRVRALSDDPKVDAVLLEHPLPAPFDFIRAVSGLSPVKDVDGVSPLSLGLLAAQRPLHAPAVARAAIAIARHYGLPLARHRVAVVGRSETVGVPLSMLLLARGVDATVTIAHSQTGVLAEALKGTSVIFSCAGRPGLLTRANVPIGAAIIDVGLSRVEDALAPGGGRTVGDANAADLEGWAGALTPVPGGVGPVTVAELMGNTVRAWQLAELGEVRS